MQQEAFLPIGTIIRDHYVVEDLHGKGEGDLVYLVRDRWTEQNLYILKERINPDKQARDRFLVEGVVLKQLHHPALQRVYRVFEENAGYRVYMLMQYIAGQDLETMHRQWPNRSFSLPLTLSLMAPIIEAVTYLHSQREPVIHRDIKPANIIVSRNKRTVLVNFGIDRGYNDTEAAPASFLCSPGYGAPEQYRGETNPGSDLYALAATFYTLLTGIVPPDARKRVAQLVNRGIDPLIRADEVTSAVPIPLAEAIHRAMSISTDERFSSVAEFWRTMHGLSSSQSIKPILPTISDKDTKASEEPPRQEAPTSFVGADLSCPPPIYRPPSEDVEEPEEQPQQKAPASPVGPSAQRSRAELISIIRHTSQKFPIELANRLRSLGHLTSTFPSPYELLSLPPYFIHLYNHIFTQRSRKPAALLLLILVFAILLSSATILWSHSIISHHPRSATSTPIAVHKATSTPTKPTPTPSPKTGSIYTGTLHDLLANTSKSISLTGMQLRPSNISGYLLIDNGSPGSGPFEGTFNAAQQHIQFVVLDSAGHPIFSFEGGVHPDGNIAGSYCALDQSGQCSGDYGLWSASPATALRRLPVS